MKYYLLVGVLLLLILSACSSAPTNNVVKPTDGQLSACQSDEDCTPLPACHPERCISKDYVSNFEMPQACTRIFIKEAAYTAEDCGCINKICVNKNDIPPEATRCFDPRATVCSMENSPVCGYTYDGEGTTYSNPCGACADENIGYFKQGEC